jgi:hypothetical protein
MEETAPPKRSVNSLISQFEKKEQKVRQDRRLEKAHLRRSFEDGGAVTLPRTGPIGFTRNTSLEKNNYKAKSPLNETPECQTKELKSTSLQESKPDTIINANTITNAEPPSRSELPPKPSALPPKEPKLDSSKVAKRVGSSSTEEDNVDDRQTECFPTVASEVEAQPPLQTQLVPPATNPGEELYDDIDQEPVKATEPNERRRSSGTMRDRPLPSVPDNAKETQESSHKGPQENKNEKAGLLGRFKKMRIGMKASKKDDTGRKHKRKKSETVIQSSVEGDDDIDDDEDDALELKEEDEYTPMDLGANSKAGNTLEPEEVYEDVDTCLDVNPEPDEGIYLSPLPLSQCQQDDFYDDVEVDNKAPSVAVRALSPRIRVSMSPDVQSEHSSGDVYEDVVAQEDDDELDLELKRTHITRSLRQCSDPLVDRALQRADHALERSRTVPEDSTALDVSTLDVGVRNGHGPLGFVGVRVTVVEQGRKTNT